MAKTSSSAWKTILAIETSCDETAAAIVHAGTEVWSNVVASQIESHKRFGGVVPEIASRHHVEQMTMVMEEALREADVTWEDVDAVAVTEGPGLVGALLVGVNAAKAAAFACGLPLIPVHHIAGHIYANQLIEPIQYPALALIVSGGHTELVYAAEEGSFEIIGETRDDAVGEAYDKVARTLGLPYPGGPAVDKLAAEGEASIDMPRAWLEQGSYDFSFSGLKSAVINKLHNASQKGETLEAADVAASFQGSVIDVLVTKTVAAAREYEVEHVLVAGGVAANRGLRAEVERAMGEEGLKLTIPPLKYCTDNAAMIGAAAYVAGKEGRQADMALNANPSLPLY
ncbi:tRNA (adenosine(37)-N6)-threonylcarbamoyltransferase complex transferase subunit TsaD [Salsuginibacillus kocurii]|uniref:tRNA (adenosine(37)-N6)-threonylcarbamoyltransferase complex transferase subunit TsaD n=1 Tax=Salsuginibacillus kocurii TaxID=427078 RepID=UPI000478321B|nr:tRNA (adenosine(37)-N6)-threonylcarbamoyltransferase complex transferase subunit TsaD [Salsuginibacillus kocurii]